jgi:hypothetical protein
VTETAAVTSESSLGQKQRLFPMLLAQLYLHAQSQGYELTLADGSIDQRRKGQPVNGDTGPVEYMDRVHMLGSLHYARLAQDLNLFVGGEYIADGGHPAWTELGVFWEGLHPLCAWGGRFGDGNHFSLQHGGKK